MQEGLIKKIIFKPSFKIFLFISLITAVTVNSQIIEGSFESKLKRYQKNETFIGTSAQNWNATAWKGERLSKQIVLWSDSNVSGLNYSVSDLTKNGDVIASSNISLRFGKYIKGDLEARSCSGYPNHPVEVEIADALSKVEITSLTSNDPIKIWISINIPSSAVAGQYSGTVTINGGISPLVFDINLVVVDYTLPDVANWNFHLDLWQFPVNILNHYNTANPSNIIAIWSDEHFALFEPAYKLLADAGQKAITTYVKDGALGAESMIKWTKRTNGTWEYDFTVFDKYVSTLMSWGITKQIDCFSPVGWNETIIPYWDETTGTMINLSAPLGSTTYNTRWDHFLTAFKTYLDNKGWFEKTVLYLDEVSEAKLNSVVSVVHGNNPNWKLGIAYSHGLSNASKANFYDLSGILEDASNDGISGNKISTFYTSCTQTKPNNYVTPENSPAEMAWMGWHAFKEGYDGYLRWAFDYWRLSDPFDARDGAHTAGDFSMIYRASNNVPSEVLSSMRLEMLRDGIQDYEKLKILQTSLESSTDPYDQEILNELNNIIDNFGKTSGAGAEQLIIQGQKAIEEIVLGTFSYCKVNGETNTGYYVRALSTSGGGNNIVFSTNQYPNTGYEHHETTRVSVLPGDSITFDLVNSIASNCARTKVWIDWNDDEDFDDSGEEVYSAGVFGSCSNSISYSIPIAVPINLDQGIKRIRIQVRKSDESEPVICGANDKTGTADFDLEILDLYCDVMGTGDYNASVVFTTGGTTNINYSGSSSSNNYVMSTEKISIVESGTFNLSVTNSNGWSRTIVWVDWNGDDDFEDAGERLIPFSPEKVSTRSTTPAYAMDVTVPGGATIGTTKMRIVTGDAWTYEDSAIPGTPCGIPTPDGTLENAAIKDFRIEIMLALSNNHFEENDDFHIYPNPVKKKIILKIPEINTLKTKVLFFNNVGQIVYKVKYDSFNSPENIIVSNSLVRGIYFVKIIVGDKIYTHKILKL